MKSQLLVEYLEPLYVKPRRSLKLNPRFKTERCRQFYEWGYCAYGDRCMFAHGSHELNAEPVRPPNYKTRICTTYQYDGFCTFGSRCAFVHTHPDPVELLKATILACPRMPMPENLINKCRPEFYPSDILTRKANVEMVREQELLPSSFNSDGSNRLSTFRRFTNSQE